jgi:hypothetical protein
VSGLHPAYQIQTGDFPSGIISDRCTMLTTKIHLVPTIRMHGSILLLPPVFILLCTIKHMGNTFPLFLSIYIYISSNLSIYLQSFVGPRPLYHSLNSTYTQSVGLLGRGISPWQGRYLHTEQQKHRITAHRQPCLEWNSNPRSQRSCLRPRDHWDRPLLFVQELKISM